jgi:hypothetical protein
LESLAAHALARAHLVDEVCDAKLNDTRAHALFHVVAAAPFDDDVVDAVAVEQAAK